MVLLSSEAAGSVGVAIRKLRKQKGLTQEQLGSASGYQAGAAVSISRLENGRVRVSDDRLERIAAALDVSPEELAEFAEKESKAPAATLEQRVTRVQRAIEDRQQVVSRFGAALNEAHERARDGFLLRLVRVAGRIAETPPHDPPTLVDDSAEDPAVEVAYGLEVTKFGVYQALADTDFRLNVGAPMAYPDFTAAVAASAVALIAAMPQHKNPAANNGMRAALRVMNQATGLRAGRANRAMILTTLAAAAVGTGALVILGVRSREQEEAAMAKLDAAEAELAESEPNFEVLQELMPRASEIFDYIAVHAAHALRRWEAQAVTEPCTWDQLDGADRRHYEDYIEIAAAHLAVEAIDFEKLMTGRDEDLDEVAATARETLDHAWQAVTTLA